MSHRKLLFIIMFIGNYYLLEKRVSLALWYRV
jgi:hypothetical protein